MQENPFSVENPGVANQAVPTAPIKKDSSLAFLLSLAALGLVIIFSGIMFAFKMTTEMSISSAQESIKKSEESIARLQKDKTVVIASLISDNSLTPSIDLKKLVANFRAAANNAWVQFQGFSVKDNIISTNLIARGNWGTDAALMIIKMMQAYAKNTQNNNFALEPIMTISGTPQNRTTPVSFKVVAVTPQASASWATATGTTN